MELGKRHSERIYTCSYFACHQGVQQHAIGIKKNAVNRVVPLYFIIMKIVNVPLPSHHHVALLPCRKKKCSTILWRKCQLKCLYGRNAKNNPNFRINLFNILHFTISIKHQNIQDAITPQYPITNSFWTWLYEPLIWALPRVKRRMQH